MDQPAGVLEQSGLLFITEQCIPGAVDFPGTDTLGTGRLAGLQADDLGRCCQGLADGKLGDQLVHAHLWPVALGHGGTIAAHCPAPGLEIGNAELAIRQPADTVVPVSAMPRSVISSLSHETSTPV